MPGTGWFKAWAERRRDDAPSQSFGATSAQGGRVGENVIAIRVEDKNGQGGLTKRCFLKYVKK